MFGTTPAEVENAVLAVEKGRVGLMSGELTLADVPAGVLTTAP
jgi:hypothetical protein